MTPSIFYALSFSLNTIYDEISYIGISNDDISYAEITSY